MSEPLPDRFETLFRDHYGSILRKLMHLVGDRAIAEDLAQEAFLRLYRTPPDDLSVVGAWLHRVSTRLAYDYTRKKSQQRRVEQKELEFGNPNASEPPSDVLVLQHAERELVTRVLEKLVERDRQVLLLRYSGYSYSEIGEIVGINQAIVGSVLHRALGRFKNRYHAEEGFIDERRQSVPGRSFV